MSHLRARVSPVLVLALLASWLLLNQSLSLGHVLLGLILAIVFSAAVSTLRPVQARLRRLDTAALLVLVVLGDIVSNNLTVARIVLSPTRPRRLHSGFVRIPLDLRDPHGLAALAAIVTATPGTVWAGLSASGDALTLHVLDLGNEKEIVQFIKQRYEKPLMRIFE
jgi:multicomponent K+:H+ antiporter subunit E